MPQLRPRNSQSDLENLLILASITKTLIVSGPRKLDTNTVPRLLSDNLVLQILKRPSIHPSKKIDFFKWCSLNSSSSSEGHCYKHSASAYSDIFRTACRGGYLDQIPVLLDSMKEDGVVVDLGTFKFLLDTFIQSEKFDSAIDILDHMEELGTSLNSSVYSSVLVALVRQNQLALALSIFLKLLEASNGNGELGNGETSAMLPDALACNELLVALRKADMRLEFKSVFDRLREKNGFGFDTWGYNICIHAFGRWGHVDTSMMLFNEMKEKSKSPGSVSVDPDLCTYNSLIHILCLVGKAKDAIIVWEELKASGHEPDPFTYRTIIQGCCKSYQMDDATKIFSEMQYNGFCPDTVVYNSLLDGLFKARKIIEACQLFEKMVQDGVRASCWTHNIIIDGLFKNGRSLAGYTLFCDLKKKGKFVDSVTYSIVVLHLCKDGQLEEALRLVEEMEGRGLVVDLLTVTSLLIGIHKQSRWDWTERLMKHIRDGFLVPSVLKWKADMETSLKNTKSRRKDFTPMFPSKGDLSEIMSFINHADSNTEGNISPEDGETKDTDPWSSSPYMDQLANKLTSINHSHKQFSLVRGQRVQANGTGSFDIDMVNTYLSIFLAKGKISIACKLFEIFTDMGVNPVSYTYNSMMSSFVKKGYFNEAWGVLHEMGENICPADIATYNVIIQGLGKMGKADLASAVLDKLMKHGGYLDIVMYNTLINALGKDGRVDEANKLFKQMKDTGINPDVVTYNTLIETHSKAGRLKDAYKFLKMMLDSGCSPNHVTDTTLDFLGKEIETLRYQKASIVRGNKGNGN